MNKKTALIIGANGQDASYMAEFLIKKGYEVHGTIRRNSVPESQTTRIEHLRSENLLKLHYMDLTDPISVESIINEIKPDEIYHLAAQSHVQISFELPKYTLDVNLYWKLLENFHQSQKYIMRQHPKCLVILTMMICIKEKQQN